MTFVNTNKFTRNLPKYIKSSFKCLVVLQIEVSKLLRNNLQSQIFIDKVSIFFLEFPFLFSLNVRKLNNSELIS